MKVVLSYIHYPLAIARYFHEAFLRRDDCEVYSVGPFTNTYIPWNGGMHLPAKYVLPPTLILPQSFIGNVRTPSQIAVNKLGVEPDLWVNIDAGYNVTKPKIKGQVVNVFTDPHVLNYDFQRTQADINFNMQQVYSKPGDRYLPYAADPVWHSPLELEKEYDVCLIGLQYANRVSLLNRLKNIGLKVFSGIGSVYDEYQEAYAKSRIALSWSSLDDLIARVFESMLMAVPLVTNRVTDLSTHFVENDHYFGFSNMAEAEQKVLWILDNYDDAMETAYSAHRKVKAQHLYDHRVSQILRECKLID